MKMIVALLALALAGSVAAGPGLWHQPDRDGHGVQISQPTSGGHAVIWYLYRPDGTASFLVADPCPEFPCVSVLYEPAARYMGGDLDPGDPVGSLELTPLPDGRLEARFDLRSWVYPRCAGSSPGGVLFNECAGRIRLELLAE